MRKQTSSAYKMFQGNPLGVRKRNYRAKLYRVTKGTSDQELRGVKRWCLNFGLYYQEKIKPDMRN